MRFHASRMLMCTLMIATAGTSTADKIAKSGRELVAENSDAVVTIRMIVEETFSFGGMGSDATETTAETTGSVIQEDGLIVAALSATDPSKFFEGLFENLYDDDFNIDIRSELKELTIIMGNGEEISAEIVLRDTDLDLVFIRPESMVDHSFSHFDLSASVSSEQFERIAVLYRLGNVANRAVTANFPRVLAVMEKPRRMYVLAAWMDMMGWTGTGRPVMTLDGKFLGITVLRSIKTVGSGAVSLVWDGENSAAEVVIPAADILESALQVPTRSRE